MKLMIGRRSRIFCASVIMRFPSVILASCPIAIRSTTIRISEITRMPCWTQNEPISS